MKQSAKYSPKHFTMQELYFSRTAINNCILNFPAARDQRCLMQLIEHVLDPLRQQFGKPITVTSGFRCPTLNTLVKGAQNSDHLYGLAADIVPTDNTYSERVRLWTIAERMARTHAIPVSKLINEKGYSWVHLSMAFDLQKEAVIYDIKPKIWCQP